MTSPGVDVIVPCYDYGRYLRQCTQSVLQETDLPIRVLIIDDASNDGSAEVARAIAAEDHRVEVIVHAENRGHVATFNEGIAWVRSRYMLLLSADDMVAPHALARAVAMMEAHPDVAFVYGRPVRFAHDDDLAAHGDTADDSPATICAGQTFIRRICARPENPVETATAVVRTSVQRRVGGYRPQLPHAGDLEMWLRCAAEGDVGYIPQVQAFARIHGENMRLAYSGERVIADYQQRLRAFELFFAAYAHQVHGASDLMRLARRALAEQALWAAAHRFEEAKTPAASQLARLAWNIDRSIPSTTLWWKILVKRTLGPRLWRALAKAAA